ncbi:MAG: M6 family metalloprotease domain-containing protein [bacterium]|nr:M6 family metalloprotease domain-containing protein [bacterium]
MSFRWLLRSIAGLATLSLLGSFAYAVAPSPEALEKWKAEGTLEQHLAPLRAFKAAGGCSPVEYSEETRRLYREKFAASADAIDTVHVVVILAEFSDWPYSGGPVTGTRDKFDSILFSNRETDPIFNPTGSMTDYYLESSYGKLLIHGEVFGPYMMPNTYAYYVDAPNSGLSGLTAVLANHAVTAADPFVNYASFNNPGMGVPIIVIHPGAGAETGAYGIWSHKADIFNTPILDGVLLQTYNVVPEEFNGELQAIGVMCHEFGHTLNLPDLYDTDGTSEGLGRWSLMASGNYNGDQKLPAHFDPWCKRRIDPISFIDRYDSLLTNRANVAIPAAQFNPVVYQLKDNVAGAGEYWLVENRPALGFDAGLPYGGLCIYHIDQAAGSNNNEARYMVALEQADGLNSLATLGSRGDAGDVWPGATDNRNFHNLSVPNSKTNIGSAVSQVGVWDISDADSVMYADLDVTYSRPYITLADWDSLLFSELIGDGDGLFEEGETIAFHCRLDNLMRPAWDWDISLHSNNPDIEMLDSNVQQTNYLSPTIQDDFYGANPIRFRLKVGAEPRITTFTLTVRADSTTEVPRDRAFTQEFVFDKAMGPVSVLIVDDDNGDIAGGNEYEESFYRLQIPYHLWNKQIQGSPTYNDLNKYSHIFWATGSRSLGGGLNATDITALKAFMDDGGNFALGSASAAIRLHLSDSAFMRDYLHTRYTDSVTTTSGLYYWGVTGSPMTDGIKFRVASSAPNEVKRMYRLAPANGGQVALEYTTLFIGNPPRQGNVGILYSGTHKSVLTSVGFEYLSISDTLSGWAHRDSMFARVMAFFGGTSTGIDDPVRPTLPKQFTLQQNYPNPFNPTTTIKYSVTRGEAGKSSMQRTSLIVYNLNGQRVRTLVDAEQGIGEYTVEWDGADERGNKVASGVYLYRLQREDKMESRKMVLLK